MTQLNSTTKDLAALVFKKLKGAKVNSPLPSQEVLSDLFENLFYASIKTEESDFIKVTITLINSKNPDPSPPGRIVKDRWNHIYFDEPIPFNVKNIVKLSKAADPWSSSLAIDFNSNNELFIWGLIDQAIHYQSFLHYEAESGPEQPGLFQTSITGIGNLVVIFDYELVATLKQNVLISNYLDVFRRGSVFEQLKTHMVGYKKKIKSYLKKKFPDEEYDFWEQSCEDNWTQSLSRILIRIQNYQHGGAFLITNNYKTDLDIKHKIAYDRLHNAICNLAELTISNSVYSNIVHSEYMEEDEPIPMQLYLDEDISDFTKEETTDEIKGAIRFIASLSCIDGLVVLNPELKVKGFGAVIRNISLPQHIYLSKTSVISAKKLVKVDPNHFGTRHRSMFSYCWKHEGSLGFVVSQDGDIRAIMKVNDKLIMWENIRVQQLIRSSKLKRQISSKLVK
jgi:hypothetical protein